MTILDSLQKADNFGILKVTYKMYASVGLICLTFFLPGCSMLQNMQKLNEEMRVSCLVIEQNLQTVAQNTAAVQLNLETIVNGNHLIQENCEVVKESTLAISQNRQEIERSNEAIIQNLQKMQAITATIGKNIAIIEENNAAVTSSTLAIQENRQALQAVTGFLNQKPSLFVIGVSLLILVLLMLFPFFAILFFLRRR